MGVLDKYGTHDCTYECICITISPVYCRVYSYPCLEVYLDKYEVSVNRIAMFYKLVQFSPFKP